MLFWQILIDGFAISALYALGATGFTLIFGVSGVLNLSHGAIMVAAAVAAWAAAGELHVGAYLAALIGVLVGMVLAFATYFITVRPIQRSSRIVEAEKEIFILTATLLWGIILQELVAYLFTNNAKTVLPIVEGVATVFGVRTPTNEFFTAAICWVVIGLLWLLVNRTRRGKAVLAASMNPRGVTLLGIELSSIYLLVWAVYGLLAGIAGVLLGMFLGVSSYSVGPLTASGCSGGADRAYDVHLPPVLDRPRGPGGRSLPASLRVRLRARAPDGRVLHGRVRHVVGPAVRFRRRGQLRPDLSHRSRRLHGRHPRRAALARRPDLGVPGGRRGGGRHRRRHPRLARVASARAVFRLDDAGRGVAAAEFRRRLRRMDRRRDRSDRSRRHVDLSLIHISEP